MIDLHSHCIAGLDDGAKTVDESLKMLEDSFRQGVTICAATPHCSIHRAEDIDKFLRRRRAGSEEVKNAMRRGNAEYPQLIFGAEIYLDNDISVFPELEKLCIGDTPYILLEFPMEGLNVRSAEWLYSMTLKGMKPIIAHVDRYPYRKDLMRELNGVELIYQINATRFLSMTGRKTVREILHNTDKCIVSSDMHNTASRSCKMKAAYEKALKKFPEDAENLFEFNAGKLLGLK